MSSTRNLQIITKDGKKNIKVPSSKIPGMLKCLENATSCLVYDEALPASLDFNSVPQGSTATIRIKHLMKIEYVDKQRHGLLVKYRDTMHSMPHLAITYVNGKRRGIQKRYYPDGRLAGITDVTEEFTIGKCWSNTGVLRQIFLTNKFGTFFLCWREDGTCRMFKFLANKTKVALIRSFAEDGMEHWNNYPCDEAAKDASILDHHLIMCKMTQEATKQEVTDDICNLIMSKLSEHSST